MLLQPAAATAGCYGAYGCLRAGRQQRRGELERCRRAHPARSAPPIGPCFMYLLKWTSCRGRKANNPKLLLGMDGWGSCAQDCCTNSGGALHMVHSNTANACFHVAVQEIMYASSVHGLMHCAILIQDSSWSRWAMRSRQHGASWTQPLRPRARGARRCCLTPQKGANAWLFWQLV